MQLSLQLLQSWGMAGREKEGEGSRIGGVLLCTGREELCVGEGRQGLGVCRLCWWQLCQGGLQERLGGEGLCKHSEGTGRGLC